jgi:RND superfamily putative drug exporter
LTLIPEPLRSGVTALVQIGTTVLVGLAIYTTIVMGLIVPALAMLFGEANWWPLKRTQKTSVTEEQSEQVIDELCSFILNGISK